MLVHYICSEHLLVLDHVARKHVRLVALMVDDLLGLSFWETCHLRILIKMIKHIGPFGVSASFLVTSYICVVHFVILTLRCILRKLTSVNSNSSFLAISHNILGEPRWVFIE